MSWGLGRGWERVKVCAALVCAALAWSLPACADSDQAPLDRLELPTGLALSPGGEWLLITNGNWDRRYSGSALVALDAEALDAGLAAPAPASAEPSASRPCRQRAARDNSGVFAETGGRAALECDASVLIDARRGRRLPSGAGNIVIDEDGGLGGAARVLIPTRLEPSVTWIELRGAGEDMRLDCEHDARRHCSALHIVGGLPDDPGRLSLDERGFPFAYLPHLLGRSLTLLALDGEVGPRVADVELQFFSVDELHGSELGGGFAVAQRACGVGNAPAGSLECARPFLVASQRFWPGLRSFRVATGLDVILPGVESPIGGLNVDAAEPKPIMGGLTFEDPEQGDRLLVVRTTPPSLTRVDTSLDESGDPRFLALDTVGLCLNPNLIVTYRPESGTPLALVSCYASDRVAVVDLTTFTVIASVAVGDGPNELLVDEPREWLWVANTADSTLSIVDLDRTSLTYLRELAVIE